MPSSSTGRGGAFSAGADVKEWAEKKRRATIPIPSNDWVEEAVQLVQDVPRCPKPTIAMIDGAAVGAGLDMALACDFRYRFDRAKFICAYTRVGYSPDCGGSWLLPRLIGVEAAKRFVFTGDTWDATKAKSSRHRHRGRARRQELRERTLELARAARVRTRPSRSGWPSS